MSTPSETMRTATIQGATPLANRLIFSEALGSSDVAMVGETPSRSSKHGGDALGVLLIDGDHQARGAGVGVAQVQELRVRLREHRRQPFARDVERRAQALVGELARQPIVEGGLVFRRRRAPSTPCGR